MNTREQSSHLRGKSWISTSLLTQQHCVSNKSGNATTTILEYQSAGLEKIKTQAQRLEGSKSPDGGRRGFRALKIHPRSVLTCYYFATFPQMKAQ